MWNAWPRNIKLPGNLAGRQVFGLQQFKNLPACGIIQRFKKKVQMIRYLDKYLIKKLFSEIFFYTVKYRVVLLQFNYAGGVTYL